MVLGACCVVDSQPTRGEHAANTPALPSAPSQLLTDQSTVPSPLSDPSPHMTRRRSSLSRQFVAVAPSGEQPLWSPHHERGLLTVSAFGTPDPCYEHSRARCSARVDALRLDREAVNQRGNRLSKLPPGPAPPATRHTPRLSSVLEPPLRVGYSQRRKDGLMRPGIARTLH